MERLPSLLGQVGWGEGPPPRFLVMGYVTPLCKQLLSSPKLLSRLEYFFLRDGVSLFVNNCSLQQSIKTPRIIGVFYLRFVLRVLPGALRLVVAVCPAICMKYPLFVSGTGSPALSERGLSEADGDRFLMVDLDMDIAKFTGALPRNRYTGGYI